MEPPELTITLHWELAGAARSGTASFADSAPRELIPALVEGCGLPASGADGDGPGYVLYAEAARRFPLDPHIALSAQGVRTGGQLWLAPTPARRLPPPRCLLGLPDGTAVVVGPRGQAVTRGWLLELLRLLNPDEHGRQELLGDASPYCYVSNSRPHCVVEHVAGAGWRLRSERDDVGTSLNGRSLAGVAPLRSGDVILLGDGDGLCLEVTLLS
jgi:hypothetical protein